MKDLDWHVYALNREDEEGTGLCKVIIVSHPAPEGFVPTLFTVPCEQFETVLKIIFELIEKRMAEYNQTEEAAT